MLRAKKIPFNKVLSRSIYFLSRHIFSVCYLIKVLIKRKISKYVHIFKNSLKFQYIHKVKLLTLLNYQLNYKLKYIHIYISKLITLKRFIKLPAQKIIYKDTFHFKNTNICQLLLMSEDIFIIRSIGCFLKYSKICQWETAQ